MSRRCCFWELAGHRQVRPAEAASSLMKVSLAGPPDGLGAALSEVPGVSDIRLDGQHGWFRFAGDAEARRDLLKFLVDRGVPVAEFAEAQADMHHEYLAAVRQGKARGEVRA